MTSTNPNIRAKKNTDVYIALAIIFIILIIIIPLPPVLLDILIALNLAFSIIIILLTMFTKDVLDFSVFPTLLLVTTLFRLGLNISATTLILTKGQGTTIIDAFGSFVIRDNYVVGFVIFLIIVIIQFVVITSGAGRVSEVTARFTLDAMPGKQMSIDADMNAGIISEAEAKDRRRKLQQEAAFYGSMDGASKFVKGDAIAGVIIVIINLLGGILIGCLFLNKSIMEALTTYALLTIGNGLVTQIPALLISTASGIIVTRSDSDSSLGQSLAGQLTAYPKVLASGAIVLSVLGLIPKLPHLIFFALAAICGVGAYYSAKREQPLEQTNDTAPKETSDLRKEPENVLNLLNIEALEIEIGYGLIPLADTSSGGDLLDRIAAVRRQCVVDMGIIVQPIRIRDNLQLATNEYSIKLKGTVVSKGEILCNHYLAIDSSGEGLPLDGIKAVEPTFGLPALWIPDAKKEEAELLGITVVDPATVMVTHLAETIKKYAHELLGRQEVKMLMDNLKENYGAVVEELIPGLMSIGEVQKVLQNLLKERVPIKDLVTILESLADNASATKDIELLTEFVRFSLARSICKNIIDENKVIRIVAIEPQLEKLLAENIQKSFQGSYPALDPDTTKKIFESIKSNIELNTFNNGQPVILCSPRIRPAFRKLIEIVFSDVIVISMNEIPTDIQIETIGVVHV